MAKSNDRSQKKKREQNIKIRYVQWTCCPSTCGRNGQTDEQTAGHWYYALLHQISRGDPPNGITLITFIWWLGWKQTMSTTFSELPTVASLRH